MTVLVTGGAGYIGSHMVLALTDMGEDVVVLDNLSTGYWWAVAPGAKLVEGDIGDEALLDRLMAEHRFDAVVHFAGSIVVPDSVRDPLGYYLNNTVKSRMLMACAVKARIPRFIFSSTAAVYGNPETQPVFEDVTPAPISPYGSSKLMTEWMLKDSHAAYGLQYIALRYFNVAGGDPKGRVGQSTPNATHLIKVACQTALGQRGPARGLRHGLSHARRHLPARLYPCERSHRGPYRRAPPSPYGRRQRHLQLRLRQGLFGAGRDQGGRARQWGAFAGEIRPAPGGRLGCRRGGGGPRAFGAGMAAEVRKPRLHRADGSRLGAQARPDFATRP